MVSQTHMQSSSVAFVNGKQIQADELKANYDGKHLAIDINANGRHFSKLLNNNDIQRILTQPAHKLSIEDSLQRDFLGKKSRKSKKSKKSMKKRSMKKRTMKKRTMKKRSMKKRK